MIADLDTTATLVQLQLVLTKVGAGAILLTVLGIGAVILALDYAHMLYLHKRMVSNYNFFLRHNTYWKIATWPYPVADNRQYSSATR